jgi:PAS domain S-box-containing protein
VTGTMGSRRIDERLLEESLEDLYEHAPCGYVSTFPDGTFAKVNQTFLAWTGYQQEELLASKRFQDLLTIAGKIYHETHYAPLLHMQGFVNEMAFDLVCRDGRQLPVLINSVQRRDASGAPLLNRTTIFNASDRREYERELLLARRKAEHAADRIARLQTITAALAEALTSTQVAEVIAHQGVAALNAQAGLVAVVVDEGTSLEIVHAVGYPADVLAARHRFSRDTPVPLADAVRAGEPILLESPHFGALFYPDLTAVQSSTDHFTLAAIPLIMDGRAIGALGLNFSTLQSFTAEDRAFLLTLAQQCAQALERARLYEAEQAARAEAQEAVRVRDAFFSVAVHELRNPLTSLLGSAQLLRRRSMRESALAERDQHTVAVIVDQATRLNKLIAELLDVSRIETGQLSIERASLDVCLLARRVVAEVQPTLTQHTVTCSDPGVPLFVNGDALRLEQVLQNLVQNAIKYSPAGGPVTVRVEQRGQMVCVAVADQGIGIPQDALPRLFQQFYRAANVDAGGIGGLGIGLFVVKEIITLHGGSMTVDSTEGGGSTFTVCLPLG